MTNQCSFPKCIKEVRAKGLCSGHYQQAARGAPLSPLEPRARANNESELKELFWSRVDKDGDCWLWRGSRYSTGYGYLKFRGKVIYAHRFAWADAVGPIPDGSVIDHLCHEPPCVNPSHLRATSHTRNMQNRKGASAHSKSGIRGVSWEPDRGRWVGDVAANGTRVRRRFRDIESAERWVADTRSRLHK